MFKKRFIEINACSSSNAYTWYVRTYLTCVDVAGLGVYDTEAGDVGITYEQMQSIIESVLVESGYYDMSRNHNHALPPFTPGGAANDLLHMARS